MSRKIFLKSVKRNRSYSVAIGEDAESAKEMIAFFVRNGVNYNKEKKSFAEVYDLVARRWFDIGDECWNTRREYSLREATTLLKYFASQTARIIAEKQGIEFVDNTGFDGETDILDTHAKEIGTNCIEKIIREEENDREEIRRKLRESGENDRDNAEEDIPF